MSKRKTAKSKSSLNNDNFRVELKSFQKTAENFLKSNMISVFTGAPGTGKDFIQIHRAVEGFLSGEFSEIIYMRSAVEVGTGIGFIPGNESEKLEPYQQAFLDNLKDMLEKTVYERVRKKVRFEHTGYCRGKTFKRCVVIVSESQNLTLKELMTVSTRLADTGRMFINGDKYQVDIKNTGLQDFINLMSDVEGFGHMVLGDEFQMRNQMIVEINKRYTNFLQENNKK